MISLKNNNGSLGQGEKAQSMRKSEARYRNSL
jgi:hypothetical protein